MGDLHTNKLTWRGRVHINKRKINLKGRGRTYEHTNLDGWGHTNEPTNEVGGGTYIRTNKLKGRHILTNERTPIVANKNHTQKNRNTETQTL